MNFSAIASIPEKVRANVQVNLPFRMRDLYMESFLGLGLNPEIGIDAQTLDHARMEDFKEVARAFQKRGRRITLHGPFMDLSPGSPDSLVRRVSMERMQQFLELLPVFQPVSLVCHAGWETRRYGWIREDWYERSALFWKEVARRVRKERSRLFLENVYEEEPEMLLRLLEMLRAEDVGFCLDTGHTSAFGSGKLALWISMLEPFIGEIHLHDNDGNSDAHLPPGQGTIDFTAVKNMFRYQRKNPILTVEPHEEKSFYFFLDWVTRELGDQFP